MDFFSNIQKVLYKYIKEDKVITQKDLANLMQVSTVAVNKWINGGNIETSKIPQLCEVLNITPNILFGFEDSETEQIMNILNSDPELKAFILSRKK